jgi:hypothetical protein
MRATNCIASAGLAALAVAPASAFAATACPAKDFNGFLAAFMDNIAVQKAYVAVPLSSISLDADAQPEPAPLERKLAAADIAYPLVPGKAQRSKNELKTTIKAISLTQIEVKLAKPDTDYQIRYLFHKTKSCWMLTRMSNGSL